MSKQASSPSVPAIRSFQFNASSAGSVKDSVNLFRGDVNLQQPLFTMPGRTEATDVAVSLLYQSNVYHDAMTFNRAAPTGVVGLGWSLPGDAIELQSGPGESPGNRRYVLIRDGGTNPLIREPSQPYLFELGEAETGSLRAGETVPAQLVDAFGQRGLALDPGASLASAPARSGALLIIDEVEQREFILIPRTEAWAVLDGGEAYQLEDFEFWKILYYPTWERWVVIDEQGQVWSYGGLAAAEAGAFAGSVGNSIEWAVAWVSDTGAPVWSGPSSQANAQRQVARAWHLASKTNLWGDQIRHAYNEQWPIDPTTGVRPVVEQLVCSDGKPYTKACYLTSITDVFGRRATFVYADKLWSSGTGQPREYADPHKPTPDNSPNGWQDRYETQYLASIVVDDPAGARLFSVELSYEPRPGQGAASAVANVNPSPTNDDPGDFYKRYLTGITLANELGIARPPVRFEYYLDATDEPGYSPGALASSTSMSGGTSRWRYTEQQLELCDRALEVTPPAGLGSTVAPRVWFAEDYAVTMWFDLLGNRASLAIYTWQGRWDQWIPDWGPILANEPDGIELTSLEVVTGTDFVAISYVSGTHRKVYAFDKDPATLGNWRPATIAGVTTAQSTPCCSYDVSSGPATLSAGDTFLLISYAPSFQALACDRLTWRWNTRQWRVDTESLLAGTRVSAGPEYYLSLAGDGSYTLHYLDPTLVWQTGSSGSLGALGDSSMVAVVGGASLVVVARLLAVGTTTLSYGLTILQWDAAYQVTTTRVSATDSTAIDWVPQIIGDTTVAVGGRLWRFDGASWLLNESLVIDVPTQRYGPRYAYGPDYAVQLYVDGQGRVVPGGARLLGYDASASWLWTMAQAVASTAEFGDGDAWPSAGGDYLTMGEFLYYRGSAADWSSVIQATAGQDLATLIPAGEVLETDATVNQGPAFIAFNSKDAQTGASAATAAMVLGNGQALAETDVGAGMRMIRSSDPDFDQPGVSAAGPATLVLFPDDAKIFSQTPSYTLYRYVGNELDGKIRHYGVSAFETDNGFGTPLATAIRIDPSTAACDPSGTWIKYYRSLVAPGVESIELDGTSMAPVAGATPYGFVAVRYLNGVEQVVGEALAPTVLDGMLLDLETYDAAGEQCSAITVSWQLFQSAARAPAQPDLDAPSPFLRGGFAVQAGVSMLRDGVSSSRTNGYVAEGFAAPFSTQPITTTTSGIGTTGVSERKTTRSGFAIQLDDAITQGVFRALNLCEQVIETAQEWQPDGQAILTTAATVTTWRSWASQLGASVYVPAQADGFAWLGDPSALGFPFASYQPGDAVEGWRRQTSMTARNLQGQVIETRDALDVPSSAIYDVSGSLPIAGLQDGSCTQDEWAYLGFESYEPRSGWTITGARELSGDAYFGERSLGLAAQARLSTTVNVRAGVRGYVLGFAVKTPAGYQPSSGTAWTVSYAGGGTSPAPIPIAGTDGCWVFRTIGLPITDDDTPSSITVTATNVDSTELLLDCVYLIPLGSRFVAQCYDARYNQVVSKLTASGYVTRSLYDDFRQEVAQLDGDGVLRRASGKALSRANASDDRFSPRAPNAALSLVFADYGTCDDFLHGERWRSSWQPNDSAAWTRVPGLLATSSGGSLRWKGNTTGLRSAALCVGVQRSDGLPEHAIAIDFADDYTIAWQPGVGWTASGPGWSPQPLVQPPLMAGDWVLMLGEGLLGFFAGGQLIFSSPWSLGVPDDLTLIASGPLALRYLGVGGGPRLGLSYSDGNGTTLQTQTLAGADAAVSASIADPLARTVATTKYAPASFEKPAELPILAYLEGFVDRQAFLAAMAGSWALTGTVADYYRGQPVGDYTPSNDDGYPYSGTRYEAVPRGRKLETGLPGASTSIHDVEQPPSTRQTTTYAYGCNSALEIDGLDIASGSYYEQSVRDPLGHATRRLKAYNRAQVAAELLDPSNEVVTQTRQLQQWIEQRDHVVGQSRSLTPNHFDGEPTQGFVNTQYDNALDEITATQVPGRDACWSLRDAAGRIRVVGLGETETVVYFVYDALGRTLECGRVDADGTSLREAIEDPSWPRADDTRTITRSFEYDGDGNSPALLGNRTAAMTTTIAATTVDPSASSISVRESYSYDTRGRITLVSQTILDEPSLPSASFRYDYDNADTIVRIVYPDGSPLAEVDYGYDDNGRVVSIGSQPGADDLARYRYAPNGDLIDEVLGGGVLELASTYTSQGWLASYSASLGSAAPFWTQTYEYQPDSTVRSRTDTTAAPLDPGVTSLSYAYDGRKQLGSATASGALPWSESLITTDANGNILAAELDGQQMLATRDPASDQLRTVQVDDGPIVSVGHDQFGNITSLGSSTTQYDPVLLVAAGFAGPGGVALLGHGSSNQRVLKRAVAPSSSTRLYFGGQSCSALAQWCDGSWSAAVYGPTGLIATVSDRTRFPIKDNLQSVRYLVDDGGAVVASFAYSAFGSLVAQAGEVDESLPRFMGQLQDPETGYYAFLARLYDPVLRRFHGPDPAHQFPSPYVFVGNQPINTTDPTGEMAWWGLIAMSAVFAVGFGLSLATGGTSAELAVDVDAVIAGIEAGLETTEAVDETVLAVEGGGELLADENTALTAVPKRGYGTAVQPSVAPAEATIGGISCKAISSTAKATGRHVAARLAGGAVMGASENGAMFLLENRKSFSFDDRSDRQALWRAMLIGALEGAITGTAASLVDMPLSRGVLRKMTKSLVGQSVRIAIGKGVTGIATSDVNYWITNQFEHEDSTIKGFVGAGIWGFATGLGASALGEGFGLMHPAAQGAAGVIGGSIVIGAELQMVQLAITRPNS